MPGWRRQDAGDPAHHRPVCRASRCARLFATVYLPAGVDPAEAATKLGRQRGVESVLGRAAAAERFNCRLTG